MPVETGLLLPCNRQKEVFDINLGYDTVTVETISFKDTDGSVTECTVSPAYEGFPTKVGLSIDGSPVPEPVNRVDALLEEWLLALQADSRISRAPAEVGTLALTTVIECTSNLVQ